MPVAALIERSISVGPTVEVGELRATLEAQATIVRVPFGAFVWNRPNAVVIERDGRVERLPMVNERISHMIDSFGGGSFSAAETRDQARNWTDKIFRAAQPDAVFSAPVAAGPYTIITASEVLAVGGFGFGSATGPAAESGSTTGEQRTDAPAGGGGGGGGGGGSSGRPVAAIVIGPEGVKIEPIVDVSKIGLAAIGAWLSIAMLLLRHRAKRA